MCLFTYDLMEAKFKRAYECLFRLLGSKSVELSGTVDIINFSQKHLILFKIEVALNLLHKHRIFVMVYNLCLSEFVAFFLGKTYAHAKNLNNSV